VCDVLSTPRGREVGQQQLPASALFLLEMGEASTYQGGFMIYVRGNRYILDASLLERDGGEPPPEYAKSLLDA
jgi:hypothetical protein